MEALWGRGRRLPSRRGTVPYPRPEGIDCGGAPAYVWFVVFVNGVAEGLLCIIVYVSGPILLSRQQKGVCYNEHFFICKSLSANWSRTGSGCNRAIVEEIDSRPPGRP